MMALIALLPAGPRPGPAPSVLELPFSRDDHGDAMFVSSSDDLIVSQRPAWLDDRGDSRCRDSV
jgi:hypothetical protein